MRVGIGLPSTLPGADGALIVEWARRAEAAGPFASLGVLDRVAYDSFEPLAALAAAAGVTTHIGLVTMIVVGPLRNDAVLAKSAASLDALAGGRLTLGVAVGARREDYEAAGVPYASRGRRLVRQLATLRDYWEDSMLCPAATRPGGPEVVVGGLSDAAFARAARYADGYVHGGGPPRAFARAADKARAAWMDLGRQGRPRLWAQGYFALGEDAAERGRGYLRDYYSFTGPFVERVVAELLTTPQAIAQFLRGYEEAGCDDLVLFPAVPEMGQLDALAGVLARAGRGVVSVPG